ncbi:MAG: hypothetical protein EXR72_16080 [Myxococcales bacterium]|nr:hypothetical protein [Myxococcales bacterium]
MTRWIAPLLAIGILGCRSGLLDGEAARAGIACGATSCLDHEAFCLFCPGEGGGVHPICGTRPPNAPDFWTTADLCNGNWGARDFPTLYCDGPEDCPAGRLCVAAAALGASLFAYCGAAAAAPGCSATPRERPLCRSLADCPACATSCERVRADLPVALCQW